MRKVAIIYFKSGRKWETKNINTFELLRNSYNQWQKSNSLVSFAWFEDMMFALHEIDQIELI